MLLLHGLVGSCDNWRGNLDALAAHASVYAIDLLNMGKSQRVEGLDAGLKATAKRIVAIMDALGLPAADIVGHSHGGAVALMLAARYPQRVRRLILFAPANPYSRSSDWMVQFYSTPLGALTLRLLPWCPALLQRLALGKLYGGPDRVVDNCLQQYTQVLRDASSVQHVISILRHWFADRGRLRRALRRLARVPTLLVWGDADYTMSLKSGLRLHRRLRASEMVVLPGQGHSVFEDAPEEANRIMLDWLARHPLPAPTPAAAQAPAATLPAPLSTTLLAPLPVLATRAVQSAAATAVATPQLIPPGD